MFILRKIPQKINYASVFADLLKNYLKSGENHIFKLKSKFKELTGKKFVLPVFKLRTGLHIILSELARQGKKRVAVLNFNAPAVFAVLKHLNLKVLPVEFRINTMNFSEAIFEVIRKNQVDTVIITHVEGYVSEEIEEIVKNAREKGIVIIEDCAHTVFSSFHGKNVGSFGDFALFSFGKGKQLNTLKGGILCTDSEEIFAKAEAEVASFPEMSKIDILKMIAADLLYGSVKFMPVKEFFYKPFQYFSKLFLKKDIIFDLFEEDVEKSMKNLSGYDFPEIVAAIACKNFDLAKKEAEIRKKYRKIYENNLDGRRLLFPVAGKGVSPESVPLEFPVFHEKREKIIEKMVLKNVDIQRTWLCGFKPDRFEKTGFYLPVYPAMREEEIFYVIEAVNSVIKTV